MKPTATNHPRITLAPGVCLFLAILILLIPLRWVLAALVSVVIHEFCHIAAIRCFGIPIYSIRIGMDGARIYTQGMSPKQEFVCALAGPFGGLALLFLAKWFPVTALCAGFHTLYNLLPVYPQDGGRALRCGTRLFLPDRWANILCQFAEYSCLLGVAVLGIYGTFVLKLGILPLFFAFVFIRRSFGMKNSLQRD